MLIVGTELKFPLLSYPEITRSLSECVLFIVSIEIRIAYLMVLGNV